jgi:hypothetical protein
MDYDTRLEKQIDLAECNRETQGFVWMHLLVVTELAIFSVRAPGFFLTSPPSPYLIASILLTLVTGGLIACLSPQLGLSGVNLGYIILFNLGSFILVDLMKLKFRQIIGDSPGEIIPTDELIQPIARTDAQKLLKKGIRYSVHNESVMNVEDRTHVVEVVDAGMFPDFFNIGTDLQINGGFVNKKRRQSSVGIEAMRASVE